MVNSKNKKIGIIGYGVVGKALTSVFAQIFLYDKYRNIGSPAEVNRADIIFICVPTPYNKKNGFDLSAVKDAFSIVRDKKIVVIKSTVLPGTTEKMQKKYPKLKILFNPEFLRAVSAKEDMAKPYEQIIGYTRKSKDLAEEILKILPRAPREFIVPSAEAEMAKYFSNAFLATRVIFANQIYDLCKKAGLNYNLIKEMAGVNPRIGNWHFDIFFEGYRGYAGTCLPKDTKSLIQLGEKVGVDLKLLKMVDKINTKLLKERKK